jgi:hypothetical protein
MRSSGKQLFLMIVSVALAFGIVGALTYHQLFAAPTAPLRPLTVTSHTTAQGFDVCQAPSMNVMRAWWHSSPYRWVNIYIGGINRACKDPPSLEWIAEAYGMGWGLVPTYVGLQVPNLCLDPSLNEAAMDLNPATAFQQGQDDAGDAANAMASEYLAPGTIVYDDMEYYAEPNQPGPCDAAVVAYINGWTQGLHSHGYKAGVYISAANIAPLINAAVTEPDDVWIVSRGYASSTGGYARNCSVYGNTAVSDSAWRGHRLYQYLVNNGQSLDHPETWGGVTMPDIDSDCADGDIVGHLPVKIAPAYTYVGQNTDGRLVVAARGKDGHIRLDTQQTPNGLWSGWQVLPGGPAFAGDPVFGQEDDGRLALFAVGTDSAVWENEQSAPDQNWLGWRALPGAQHFTGTPALSRNGDGTMDIFARDTSGNIWQTAQIQPNGNWMNWQPLAGPPAFASNPVVAQDSDGRLEVFARSTDGQIWLNFQQVPGGDWFGWLPVQAKSPITFVGTPSAVRNADGRLAILRGADGNIWFDAQKTQGGIWGVWSRMQPRFAATGDTGAGIDRQGRVLLAVTGADHDLWLNAQKVAGTNWTGWLGQHSGQSFTSTPAVAQEADGRMEVFALSASGDLWHVFQTTPGGAWGKWSNLQGGANLQQ